MNAWEALILWVDPRAHSNTHWIATFPKQTAELFRRNVTEISL
jgi:hypothetical protein